MPIARVQMPDGRIARIEVPEGTTPEQATAMAQGVVPKQAAQPKPQSWGQSLADSAAAVGGSLFRGAAMFPDMLADGGDAVTRGATSLVSSGLRAVGADGAARVIERGSPGDKRQVRIGDIPDMLGAPRMMTGAGEFIGNVLGGLAIPAGPNATAAQTAAQFPGTYTPTRLQRIGAKVMRRPAPVATRPTYEQVMAPVMDGATSATQYAPRIAGEVVGAGARQNIPVRAPDADPVLRGQMAKVEASPYGGPKIASALDADKALMQTRVAEVGGPGTPHKVDYSFGGKIQDAGRRFIKDSGTTKNALYTRAEQRAGGARVVPDNTIAAIDANIAELAGAGENSNASVINYLKGLRQDLVKPGGFSITEFQGLRAANRAKIRGDQALTMSDADRRLGDVLKTFTDDAANQLPPDAVGALRTADKYYAQRQDYINGVLKKFMGGRNSPLAPERAGERMRAMSASRADYDTLSRFMAKAEPEERADIAATFAENLGKARNGEFGLGTLATNIENMPPNVRQLVFGKDGASALEDLRVLAGAKSATAKGLNNSRSGVVMARQIGTRLASSATAGGMVGGWAGAVIGPAITETIALVGQRRAANLLLNPQFTKAIRSVGTNPSAASAKVLATRLSVVAARNPAIADEVGAFMQAMNTNVPQRLSAGEAPEDQRR